MVKKRFECSQDKTIGCYYIWDKYYGKHLMLFDVREHIKRTCDLLNELHDEILTLKSVNIEYEDALARLEEKNEQLKQIITDKEVEWLRDNTVWEQMPTSKPTVTKTTLNDKND